MRRRLYRERACRGNLWPTNDAARHRLHRGRCRGVGGRRTGAVAMTREFIFSVWAPAGTSWSDWVKPVVFARLSDAQAPSCPPQAAADVNWCPPADGTTAIVVDLPGGASVAMGLALAEVGYRPVPLYNSAPGPAPVLDTAPVVAEIVRGTPRLREARLLPEAPPAFLLD